MKQRNVKPAQSASEKPINLFARSILRAIVSENPRTCGHLGHFVEVEVFLEERNEWFSVGLFTDLVLHDAIILLQQAEEFVGQTNGVRSLPTVCLDGKSYLVDRRLGEFRNVDDPSDRIEMN